MVRKIKLVQTKVGEKPTFGTNPKDPWSAKAGISESPSLERYLKSKGIDPRFVSKDTKISHSKSTAFLKWKQDHMFGEEMSSNVSSGEARSKSEHSPTAQRAAELDKAKKHGEVKVKEEVTLDETKRMSAAMKLQRAFKREQERSEASRKRGDELLGKNKEPKGSQTPALTPEEVQLTELKKSTLADYVKKAHKDASYHANVAGFKAGVEQPKYNTSDDTPREIKREKGIHRALSKLAKEDVGDPKAAVNGDGLPNPQLEPVSERKREMSKSARMIKALYKKKGVVKEEIYDHEKEDKSVATYGKKPKFDKADPKDSVGEKKPQAAAVLTGGTTLTGSKRDDIEIDPAMRNRPGQPDVTKKDDKKDDKKKDEKKDK